MPRPMRPRDDDGWAIPSSNTISFYIYIAMKQGLKPTKIAKALGLNTLNVSVLGWAIRHPDARNERQKLFMRKKRKAFG